MKKKTTAKLVLTTFGLSVMLPTAAMAATDTQGHWAGSVLDKWEQQALISGYEDGTIRPDQEISRAEFVALVNRVAGYQAATNAVTFDDVKAGDWYAGQVAAAVNQGYIGGFEDGTFRPNESVTRAQAAAILARLKNLDIDGARADQFADAAEIPGWAKGVIGAVANAGYMVGDTDNQFNANKPLTRAEAVSALDRVFAVQTSEQLSFTLSQQIGVINKGASKVITVKPSANNAVISASSSDETVASVTVNGDKVTIKGISVGSVTITITAKAPGYKDAVVSYDTTVAVGGGASSGGSVSSDVYKTVKPVVEVPAGVDEAQVSIQTIVYDEGAAQDAKTIVTLPEGVAVKEVTLPEGASFKAVGVNVVLEKAITRVPASARTRAVDAGTITVQNVKDAIDMEQLDAAAKEKLESLHPDRVLIRCTQDGDNLIWDIDGMSPTEQADVFAQLKIVLEK